MATMAQLLRRALIALALVLCCWGGLSSGLMAPALAGPNGAASRAATGASSEQDCSNPGQFVQLEGQNVLEIRHAPAPQRIADYVRRGNQRLLAMAQDPLINPSQLQIRDDPPFTVIGLALADGQFQTEMGVDDAMARCFGQSRQQLARFYRDRLAAAILRYRSSHSLSAWLKGTGLAALVLATYLIWWRVQGRINERLRRVIEQRPLPLLELLRRLGIGALVEPAQVRHWLQGLRQLLHWSLLLLLSYLLIPLLLGLFPPTQLIAAGLRQHLQGLVLSFLGGVVQAIPNVLSIVVISLITVLAIRGSNAWFRALESGRVRLPGFYPEWAQPTARLVAIVLTLAGLVAAFPYIPGSDSKVFQGAGLLVGVLATLGSSAIASNVISGLMLIYTRAFREGDRVEINGVLGVVQDRALLVTRLQTPRNELVSIPNATVIGASVVNFSFSRREIQQPVALATTITIGYDVPWRQVHELMLNAARSVDGITDEVEPFVLQTSLNDYHISYELNAFVRDAASYRQTLSAVLAALQDQFAAADVEILSPGYHAIRNGNRSTVPPQAAGD